MTRARRAFGVVVWLPSVKVQYITAHTRPDCSEVPKKTEHSGHSLISFIFNNEAVWVVKSCMIEMCSLQENKLQSQRFRRDVPLQNLLMNDRFHRPYLVSFRTFIVVIFKIFHGQTLIELYEHTFSHLRTTTRTPTRSLTQMANCPLLGCRIHRRGGAGAVPGYESQWPRPVASGLQGSN